MTLDKQKYEEHYGEAVGFCNIHKVAVADNNCDRCMEHDCKWLSMCCGEEPNEYVDYFCSGCNEGTTFQCDTCEEEKE